MPEPLTYYYRGGPISEVIEAVRSRQGSLRHVAVVGLGTGALACYRHRSEAWTFYEIDPAVVQIGRNPRFFTFISACAPDLPVVVGDARLTLAASTEKYDLIVLDAFSSDSIPTHLLTREAVESYLNHLAGGGVILMHISSRYMELADTVAAVGAADGLRAFIKIDDRPQTSSPDYKMNAEVVALARRPEDVGDLRDRPGWHQKAETGVQPWTDDYSNILGAIISKQREGGISRRGWNQQNSVASGHIDARVKSAISRRVENQRGGIATDRLEEHFPCPLERYSAPFDSLGSL